MQEIKIEATFHACLRQIENVEFPRQDNFIYNNGQ